MTSLEQAAFESATPSHEAADIIGAPFQYPDGVNVSQAIVEFAKVPPNSALDKEDTRVIIASDEDTEQELLAVAFSNIHDHQADVELRFPGKDNVGLRRVESGQGLVSPEFLSAVIHRGVKELEIDHATIDASTAPVQSEVLDLVKDLEVQKKPQPAQEFAATA